MTQPKRQSSAAAVGGPPKDEECTTDIFKLGGPSNNTVIFTDEAVVAIDTGTSRDVGTRTIEIIRNRTKAPVQTIVYTHGHPDHTSGITSFLEDAGNQGHPKPKIIAQELVPRRFQRYEELDKHNTFINRIQFGRRREGDDLPPQHIYPDITYTDAMQFRVGGLTFELYRAMGETDDATWVWIPERKTAIVGDLIIWACPNIGNPFKIQRYEVEWAEALETVAAKNPDFVIPGHGPILRGKEQIQNVCLDTARLLRHMHSEVVRLLNEGCWIEEILERVNVPQDLLSKPWLTPSYGHPIFITHAIHRRYAGWYNGNPSDVFPAKSSEIAAEVVGLCGTGKVVERAKELREKGEVQLALNVLDFAVKGASESEQKEASQLKAELLDARAEAEASFIARNIFRGGAKSIREEAGLV